MNIQTKSKKTWNKIRTFKGINRDKKLNLVENDTLISDPQTVADKLVRYFYDNSSDRNYDNEFLNKEKTRKSRVFDTPQQYQNLDSYQTLINSEISITEFEIALSKCNSKSPGPDGIPFSFLHNLPKIGKTYLLQIFNSIWNSGNIPPSWKNSCIIPIPKEGKNKFNTSGYRPISLLNTMCKLLEKVINLRFMWFIERINYLSPDQNGFRYQRGTNSSLIKIQSEIENATKNKQSLGMVSLDIEKAYDTAWRPHIISKLQKILCQGNMLKFITNFLSNRTFQVKVNNVLSETFDQQNGVTQGSTLSVTLFLISINDITKSITNPVKCTLYADDFNIFCRSNELLTVQSLLQKSLNYFYKWSQKSGFKFSAGKSQCITFKQKKKNFHCNGRRVDNTINILVRPLK